MCSYGNISISYIEVCTHTHAHVELEGSQATSFNDTQTPSQGTFPASESWAAPRSQGRGAGNSPHARQGRAGLTAGCTARPQPHRALKGLTWEQFCSGRSPQHYGPGLSGNWRSCSAPWRCGAGSSLLSCKEEQKQDGVSGQVTPPSPRSTFFSWSLCSKKFALILSTSSPPAHSCQCNSSYNPKLAPRTGTPRAPGGHKYAAAIQLILDAVINTTTLPVARCCRISKSELLNWKTLKRLIFRGKAYSTFCNTAITGSLLKPECHGVPYENLDLNLSAAATRKKVSFPCTSATRGDA